MFPYLEQLNMLIAVCSLIALAILVIGIVWYTIKRESFTQLYAKQGEVKVGMYIMYGSFAFALVGTIMSLLYSEVFDFVPCGLCWLQRVFLFPQVVLLGIALYKKDRSVADTLIILSIIGAFFAGYQYILQMTTPVSTVCLASEAESCAIPVISEFGFVTFPLISLILFLWQIALIALVKNITPKNS